MFAWRACEIDSPEAGKKPLAKEHALIPLALAVREAHARRSRAVASGTNWCRAAYAASFAIGSGNRCCVMDRHPAPLRSQPISSASREVCAGV